MSETPPSPDPGSFRDPLSRVFHRGDRVLRALTPTAAADFDTVAKTPFFARALDDGKIIGTRPAAGEAAGLEPVGRWTTVVEHPRLPVWSYPYEWPFSMLQAAALAQLELQLEALADGVSCKDATPYNLQFEGVRPVFVDVGSFEPYRDGDPWYGYLQFCQLFLYPLLLQAYAEVPFHPLLRGALDGITPEVARRMLGTRNLVRKGVPVHVALHARAQRRFADTTADVKSSLQRSGYRKSMVEANVTGLRHLVGHLRWQRSESTWSAYGDRGHYSSAELETKEHFVRDAAGRRRRHLAWDIGCNDGRFSRLIAPGVDHVIAFDGDHLVVDQLFRSLRAEGPSNITPLVVDLADPPPSLGWAHRERRSFLQRFQPDFVLALAVVHHLALTANVPTAAFLDLLRSLGADAVVEFPTEDDPMVHRLLRNKRAGVHDDYRLATFEEEVDARFDVRCRESVGTRVLFELAPR